jgi:hypothetical protein
MLLLLQLPQLLLQGCNVPLLIQYVLLLIMHVLLLAMHAPVSCTKLMLQVCSVCPASCTAGEIWHKT